MPIQSAHQEVNDALGMAPEWVEAMSEAGVDGFWQIARDFWLADSRIPNKYKELTGLALSGATGCKYCALFHAEAARLFGATDTEVEEANMMSALAMVGRSSINGQQADYDQFKREILEIIHYVKSNTEPKVT